jgi:hypothetical protein
VPKDPRKSLTGKNRRTEEPNLMKVGFYFRGDVAERLRAAAFVTRKSQSQIVMELLEQYLAQPQFRNLPKRKETTD